MTDDIRRDESVGRDSTHSSPGQETSRGQQGSPLGTDPQEASPLPGDPREAQERQEPGPTPMEAAGAEDSDHDEERAVVDQLKDAWDRRRGK